MENIVTFLPSNGFVSSADEESFNDILFHFLNLNLCERLIELIKR